MNYWLAVGTAENWKEAFEKGNIWGLRDRQKRHWDTLKCFPPDKWKTDRITSELLRYKTGIGFQNLDSSTAQELISKFKPVEVSDEPITHREIKEKLIEIGKLQGFIAEQEYSFDLGRLDVVWRKVERSVPTYVFEVCIKGDLYHDLAKLKHAFDLWNSRIFIVAPQTEHDKVRHLLSGSFHEILEQLKFLERIKELYESKRAFLDLEKELGL